MGGLGFQAPAVVYSSDRPSDGLRCAVATCIGWGAGGGLPITLVPGGGYADLVMAGMPPVFASIQCYCDLAVWTARQGFRMVAHAKPPTDRPMWVGLGVAPFSNVARAVVLSRTTIVHDPTPSLPALSRINRGLTFERIGAR